MLHQLVKAQAGDLTFTLLDLGAAPLSSKKEPFYRLIDDFPGSRILAFEVDPAACERLNAARLKGLTYFACALGRGEEERDFYETMHPMCSSLYEPDEAYADVFQNLHPMRLKRKTKLRTVGLEYFARQHAIGAVDFIKIDIQGAELEVLQSGAGVLQDVLLVEAEVEFVPLYKKQPLFGDVTAYLTQQELLFHKFLGFSGRAIKPLVVNNDPDFPVQCMWSDAVYVRNIFRLELLEPRQLLKLAVLLNIYNSQDATHFALQAYDKKCQTKVAEEYLRALMSSVR